MKYYEITCLISPDLLEPELELIKESVSSSIREEGGTLMEIKAPIKENLGYPIRKKQIAYLLVISFNLEGEKLKNLDRKLKLEPKILRYIMVTKNTIKETPAVKSVPQKEIPEEIPKEEIAPQESSIPKPEKRVELNEIEEELKEILNE